MKVKPMGTLLMMQAGWVNRHRPDVMVKTRVVLAHHTNSCIA
jgi:hypothetical protein